jgi:hypothetical protein
MKTARGFALILALALPLSAMAAGPYHPPRNRLGQPVFEGLWSTNSLTKLERPDIYPTVVISEAQARAVPSPQLIPPDETGQAETETYDPGLALARIGSEIRTAWVVDPADGRLPFTPAGRARAVRLNPFGGPEDRATQERCLMMPSSGPPLTNGLYNNNVQILQTRDHLVIFMEPNHEARTVAILSGKPSDPPAAAPGRWMGDTVGWWEGEVFAMRTTGFHPGQGQRISPIGRLSLSPDAVVTERLKRLSPTQILYSYTVEDPANYTRPWRGEMPLNAAKGPIYEYACHEGNYSLPNILAGARAQERTAQAGR